MCGILAIVRGPACQTAPQRHAGRAEVLLQRLQHRGPDGSGSLATQHGWLGHRRLSIMDPVGGRQPFADEQTAWIVNGEIFNHQALRTGWKLSGLGGSDSAVVGPLWRHLGVDTPSQLDGQFAFVAIDRATGAWIAARDPIGICPLFIGRHDDGSIWFASEMKALVDDCRVVEPVQPGSLWHFDGQQLEQRAWYQPSWKAPGHVPDTEPDLETLRDLLVGAVHKRLMSDVPFGFLLSGGLDSSLIAAIAARWYAQQGGADAVARHMHTFSIGLSGAPDLLPARRVAEYLGTTHHEFHFSLSEALEAVPQVAWHMETVEQVRTAVPTFLLARRIRELGFKMVLSGEGADEIFGGYLYFHRAPDEQSFFAETVRKVTRLHQFDVARADRAPMAHGLEMRFPFLDQQFVDYSMSLAPRYKLAGATAVGVGKIEKSILRQAFEDRSDEAWLPGEILWRQKEQFSDGVGYSWVDQLRQHSADRLTAESWENRRDRFPMATPQTAEQYWMRELFEDHFVTGKVGGASAAATLPDGRSIACSTPEALAWDPAWQSSSGDISGRTMRGLHQARQDIAVSEVSGEPSAIPVLRESA